MSISRQTIDSTYQTAQIEQVVADFVTLNKKGTNYVGNCPFHDEKTPSFTVSPSKNIYKCFGCGAGGNSVTFLMEHEKLSYPEAIKYLAKKYSIAVEEEEISEEQQKEENQKQKIFKFNNEIVGFFQKRLILDENSKVLEYAKSRFNEKSIKEWQIGFAPGGYTTLYNMCKEKDYSDDFLLSTGLFTRSSKNNKIYDLLQNRLIFPVCDRYGNIISFTGRILPDADKAQAKFINLGDTAAYRKRNTLYGLNFALANIAKTKIAVLVEGNPDCIHLSELGVGNVVAPSGTALSVEQISLIKRFAEKVTLLYDGDTAGQSALLKNGKILVEKGLFPYAAVLPEKEDPASFFKSKNDYDNWILDNKKDWISWYANELFAKVGDDPSLKNDAINNVCEILMFLEKSSRQLYIDGIAKNSKVKGKLFADKLKELEQKTIKNDKPTAIVPKDVDANDFEKWGFYEENNSYYFRIKGRIEKLTNFTMKPVIHVDSVIDSKRIYELINEHGYSVVAELNMQEMTSLQGFQRNVESKGNFIFWGTMPQFIKLKLKLYEETRTCQEIKNLGWQKEGFWAWSNGIIEDDGNFAQVDEFGIIKYNNQDFFIPAFSKINIKDKSIFIDERKFQYKKSNVTLQKWQELFIKVHGDNAMVAFAWYLAALFRDHILYLNDNFPLLNLFGQKGSGKNTLSYSLLSLFGKKQTEFNINNGTQAGLAKLLEIFQNGVAFVDEYKNNLDFSKIEGLKSIYNAIGRGRINMDKGGKKETTEVNQSVMLAGQEMPTIDTALSSRTLFLEFLPKEGLSNEAKLNFEQLQKIERDGLSHLTTEFIKHRKYFVKNYKENYDSVMAHLSESTKNEEIYDRLLRNLCSVIAAFKTMETKFTFTFDYYQLTTVGLRIVRNHNKQLQQSDELGVFWKALDTMYDDNTIINKWHFRVTKKHSLKTTKGDKQWPKGKNILRIKFNVIWQKYAEEVRKANGKALPADSLMYYLKTTKYFIGTEKACKFITLGFDPSENKHVEKDQVTTALCFDYDKLDINLVRKDVEAGGGINKK